MKKIYTSKCKIRMPHDFPDYPCKKCNGIILDTDKITKIVFAVLLLMYVSAFIINLMNK